MPAALTRREWLRLSAGALLSLGVWPGRLRGADAPTHDDFTFIAVNDLHALEDACRPWFDDVVRQMKASAPTAEFCLLGGDLADNGTPQLPTFKPHPSGALRPVAFWTSDTIRRCIDVGSIVRADSLEELFSMLDLPVVPTAGAVRRYNESASLGQDRDFGKDARFVRPIEKPPFHGVELRPAAIGATSYGMQIDAFAQVLHESQAPIAGLFAAGECTGGTLGSRYLSSGNSLGNCFVFGRVAGRSAARHALGPAAQP